MYLPLHNSLDHGSGHVDILRKSIIKLGIDRTLMPCTGRKVYRVEHGGLKTPTNGPALVRPVRLPDSYPREFHAVYMANIIVEVSRTLYSSYLPHCSVTSLNSLLF